MSMTAEEIIDWLATFNSDEEIGIDEGGLCLTTDTPSECYLEIGGTSEGT